jgi:hypothetical protein
LTPRPLLAILGGGLTAGVLDITDALVFYGMRGVKPVSIFQSISSGLLGRDAYAGGMKTAVLGFCLHFFIAISAATVYYFASKLLPILWRRPLPCGALYGAIVRAVMYYIVLPLSAVYPRPGNFSPVSLTNSWLIHILGIGIPIALFTHAAFVRTSNQ